eukprot:4770633-Pleurochrysis_carterae.AAC.3
MMTSILDSYYCYIHTSEIDVVHSSGTCQVLWSDRSAPPCACVAPCLSSAAVCCLRTGHERRRAARRGEAEGQSLVSDKQRRLYSDGRKWICASWQGLPLRVGAGLLHSSIRPLGTAITVVQFDRRSCRPCATASHDNGAGGKSTLQNGPGATTTTAFPAWPQRTDRRDLEAALQAFQHTVTSVPLKASASSEGWREWSDGGFAAHKFIASKLTRFTYVPVLSCLRDLIVNCQRNFPDLYAVLKFVPKKNGLNPLLALLEDGQADAVRLETLRPREVRRRLDDLLRALEQSWLLFNCYLTLPNGAHSA